MNLTIEQRGKIIGAICFELQIKSDQMNQTKNFNNFDCGDTFFSLAFKSDKELEKIAGLCLIDINNYGA